MTEPQAIDPTRVAIYIRWSTEDQGEGTTLDVQSETCKAYLISQGWAINPDLIFIDDGYSGGSLERPAMARLRRSVAGGEVDCVVVYKLDRLSRSVVDTVNLVCREWEGRCSIKSAREPIDTTSHAGKMFFYTLVNYAEWERSVIRERTFSGKLRRAQEGRNPGMRPPYGYRLGEAGAFTVEPGEAALVARIYQLYLAGMGVHMITQSLNRDGYKPRLGRAWTQSTVARILSNPAYIGRLEYGRRRRTGTGRSKAAPLVSVDTNQIPPLVARADWETVQALKAERPGFGRGLGSGRSAVSDSLLTGVLRCRCGHAFTGKAQVGKYRYYRCLGVQTKGSAFCDCGSIRRELLDELVVSALRTLYGGEAARHRLICQVVARWEQQLAEARGALSQMAAEAARLTAGEQRIKRLLREGHLEVGEYRDLKRDLDHESADVRAAWEKAQQLEQQALSGLMGQERLAGILAGVDEWDQLDRIAQKHVLRQFIQEIRVYRRATASDIDCQIIWRRDRVIAPQ